jgi:hypothetical protein
MFHDLFRILEFMSGSRERGVTGKGEGWPGIAEFGLWGD